MRFLLIVLLSLVESPKLYPVELSYIQGTSVAQVSLAIASAKRLGYDGIRLNLNGPGGNVGDGLNIISMLYESKLQITCTCHSDEEQAFCASMSAWMLMFCPGRREIDSDATIVLHAPHDEQTGALNVEGTRFMCMLAGLATNNKFQPRVCFRLLAEIMEGHAVGIEPRQALELGMVDKVVEK